jgi:hypothetical protein
VCLNLPPTREARAHGEMDFVNRPESSQSRVAKIEAAATTVSADLPLRALFAVGATPGGVATVTRKRRSLEA